MSEATFVLPRILFTINESTLVLPDLCLLLVRQLLSYQNSVFRELGNFCLKRTLFVKSEQINCCTRIMFSGSDAILFLKQFFFADSWATFDITEIFLP